MDSTTRRTLIALGVLLLLAYVGAVVLLYRHPSAGERHHESLRAAWAWLMSPPPRWASQLLGRYLRILVPVMFFVSLALAVVQRLQAATVLQRALWRFLAAKAFFWAVFWLALHHRETILYLALDFLAVSLALLTALELGARLIDRYLLGRRRGSARLEGGAA